MLFDLRAWAADRVFVAGLCARAKRPGRYRGRRDRCEVRQASRRERGAGGSDAWTIPRGLGSAEKVASTRLGGGRGRDLIEFRFVWWAGEPCTAPWAGSPSCLAMSFDGVSRRRDIILDGGDEPATFPVFPGFAVALRAVPEQRQLTHALLENHAHGVLRGYDDGFDG